jgi:hypothetical protein
MTTERCKVKGCGGVVDIRTNGHGSVVATCPRCDKRAAWLKANKPKPKPKFCRICDGPLSVRHEGRGGNSRRYCEACLPLVKDVGKAKARENYRLRTQRPTLRKVS